jgi:hypothetical protein
MKFNEIQSRNQLADFLGIQRKTLTYVLFEARVESFYSSFDIPKKDGTLRNIYVNGKPPTSFSMPRFFEIIVCS